MSQDKSTSPDSGGEPLFTLVCVSLAAIIIGKLGQKLSHIFMTHWFLSSGAGAVAILFIGFYLYAVFQIEKIKPLWKKHRPKMSLCCALRSGS